MSRRKGRATTETVGVAPVQFPTGCVLPFAGTTAPEGWLLCDGSAISRTTYAGLYATIGDAHGNGDGSTTFHIPDLRGRFVRGVDKDGTGAPTLVARDPDRDTRTAANAGGNTGNNVGSVQDDALQNITGSVVVATRDGSYGPAVKSGSGGLSAVNNGNTQGGSSTSVTSTMNRIELNAANSPSARTSTESRSKNINLNHIIKI